MKETILTTADLKAKINNKTYQLFSTVKILEKETNEQLHRRIEDKKFTLRLVYNPDRFITTISKEENLVLIWRNKIENNFSVLTEDDMENLIASVKN
jgi:hypothetical protein